MEELLYRFTERELDILEVLWSRPDSSVGEVLEHLADPIAYTTVQTMMGVLERKRFVNHRRDGRTFRYSAIVPRAVATRSAVDRLLDRFFGGSREHLLSYMSESGDLSDETLRSLRREIAHGKKRSDR
jgi:BlaI family penicillinase repressor